MLLKKILLSGLCCFMLWNMQAQTRHALIVAIGNYPNPDENLWPVISSVNDVPLIKNALISNQGFEEKNVQVLIDSQATKAGIVAALDKLIASVNKGDIVVIHFSSHGQQIEDDNGDEIDGLDECIVPYGAVFSQDETKYKDLLKGYLRDDLFGDKITLLRNKLGKEGDVLVTLDACHSGSGTRGVETNKIRGGNVAMVSSNFKKNIKPADDAGVFKETVGATLNADAATFVLISGAQAAESNYECYDDNNNPVGSLSYAFSKAMSSLKGAITYRGLFAQIENVMLRKAPKQKPVLEGDGLNRELFGGKYKQQLPYFSVNVKQSKNDMVVLNGGFVAGVSTGTAINFYETGTTNPAGKKPLGSGKVIDAAAFSATVKLDSGVDVNLAKSNPWAFVNELAYGTEKIKLLVKGNKAVIKMLQDSLKDFKLVEFNENCDLYVDTDGAGNKWALKYPNTSTVFQTGFNFNPGQPLASFKDALKRYDRFRYLKGLQFNDPALAADVQLVFVDAGGNVDSNKLNSRLHMGRLELKEGDNLQLRIVNTGKKDLYVNIVDIQPDGIINPVLPNKDAKDAAGRPKAVTPEECLLKRGETIAPCTINVGPPYGEETFKVFLSTSLLDLEDILTTKSQAEAKAKNKRGVLDGLEKIFVESNVNEVGKRGVTATSISTQNNGTIFSFNFQIIPN